MSIREDTQRQRHPDLIQTKSRLLHQSCGFVLTKTPLTLALKLPKMVLAMLEAAAAHFPMEYSLHVITALITVLATYFILQGCRTTRREDEGKEEQQKKGKAQLGAGTADMKDKDTRGEMGEVGKGKMTSAEKGGTGQGGNDQGVNEEEGEEDKDGEWGMEWWEGYTGGWGEEGQWLG